MKIPTPLPTTIRRAVAPAAFAALALIPAALHGELIARYNMEETASPLVDQAGGQTADAYGAGHLYQQAGAPAGTYGGITLTNTLGSGVGLSGTNTGTWRLDPPGSTTESAEMNALTNDFTVMAWVYVPAGGIPATSKTVIGDDDTWDGDAWSFGLRNGSGILDAIEFTGNGVKGWATADSVVTTGWQHIAVTKSATTGVRFYHNGVFNAPRDTAKENDNLTAGNDIFALGRSNAYLSNTSFNGGLLMDEVRVYDTVLDAAAIIAAAEDGQIGPPSTEPVFNSDPVVESNAQVGAAYTGSTLAGHVTDPDTPPGELIFTKLSAEPAWLTVAANGALSGTPGAADTGINTWTVSVTDGSASVEATLEIHVVEPPSPDDAIVHYDCEETGGPLIDQAGGESAAETGTGHLYQQTGATAGTYGAITLTGSLGSAVGIGGSANGAWQLDTTEAAELNSLTNDFTVMAWVHVPAGGVPANSIKSIIGDDVTWDGDAWAFSVRNKDYEGTFRNAIEFTGNNVKGWDTDNDVLTPGAWQHVAVTKSATTGVRFYHNGIFRAPRDTTRENDDLFAGNDVFGVGRANASAGNALNGGLLIDEVRVYDTVLDTAGIIAAAKAGQAAPGAPFFTSHPLVKADAAPGRPYSGASLAGDVSDSDTAPENLAFAKLSGPAWLVVGPDGALSGTPASAGIGLNSWIVTVNDGATTDSAQLLITVAVADVDEDGLPDDWETAHGLDPADDGSVIPDNGADGDPDGDGLPNDEEFIAGLDPRTPDRTNLSINGAADAVEFTVPAAVGPGYYGLTRTWQLQFSPDLVDWDLSETAGIADGAPVTFPIPAGRSEGFYRLAITLRPADGGVPVEVRNSSVPGTNSRDGLTRLPTVLGTHPDHLAIFYGMNDAMNYTGGKLIGLPEFRQNLASMVSQANAAGVQSVLLVGIHPVNTVYLAERHPGHPEIDRLQEHLAEYDTAAREVAASTGAIFVDWRARFLAESPGDTIEEAVANQVDALIRCEANSGARDGNHLTAQGNRFLAAEVARHLRTRVNDGDLVVCMGDSITYGSHMVGQGTATGDTYPAFLVGELSVR